MVWASSMKLGLQLRHKNETSALGSLWTEQNSRTLPPSDARDQKLLEIRSESLERVKTAEKDTSVIDLQHLHLPLVTAVFVMLFTKPVLSEREGIKASACVWMMVDLTSVFPLQSVWTLPRVLVTQHANKMALLPLLFVQGRTCLCEGRLLWYFFLVKTLALIPHGRFSVTLTAVSD